MSRRKNPIPTPVRGRGRAGDDLGVRNDGHGQVSGGGISGVIWAGKSCAITAIIAQRTGVRKRPLRTRFAALAGAGNRS